MKVGDRVVSKDGQRGRVTAVLVAYGVPWVVVYQEDRSGYSGPRDYWLTLQEAYS